MKNSLIVLCNPLLTSKLRNLCMLFAVVLLCIGCDELTSKSASEESPEEITEVEASSPTDKIHVAFAGGGWRAHTAHTAWTMSLLENNGNKLENAFKNVNTISSNSGGSWFSTMLMYSPKFVTDIEKPRAIDTWKNTTSDGGWLGGQQNIFDGATLCTEHSEGPAFAPCVFKAYGDATEWDRIVKKIVYKDYPLNDTLTLNSSRQKWATNKSLLLAGSMLTNNVVLNEDPSTYGDYYGYYQACLSPLDPKSVTVNGEHGGSCSYGANPDVTPVIFSSIPSSSNMIAPPFLPAAGAHSKGLVFNVGYSNNFSSSDIHIKSISNPLSSNNLSVRIAASASSAALGFEASKNLNVFGTWGKTYDAEDLALNFSLVNPDVEFIGTDNKTIKELADNKMVRIADGGAVDNSGIAQLIPFLQKNKQKNGFNIVAFDNVQEQPFLPGVDKVEAGGDIALLFGYGLCEGNKLCLASCSISCVHVPEIQIFEASALGTPATWSFQNTPNKYTNTPKLIYTKYTVTTTANASFDITPGLTGTLHVFTCYYPSAGTQPQNYTTDGDFKAYNNMMHFINDGLKANSNEGLTHLEKAMGLK
ncbi:hypothetical protein [Dokdonia sp.]|uniref:hypothetical protein n=1 Tax=Dokdonia sp. TaxID=2024995 RepID=UPI003263A409